MKKIGEIIDFTSEKMVKFIILMLALVLAYWAARYTYFYPADYGMERVVIAPDSMVWNAVSFVMVAIASYVIQKIVLRGSEEQKRKRVSIFAVIDIVLVGGLLVWYVSNTHIPPYWDQAQVFQDALSFKAGEYSDMNAYLNMYPQQYGLIFVYQIMFLFGPDQYITMEYFNVFFLLVLIYFTYKLAEELFHSAAVSFYSICAMTLFLPVHIYVNFVYGDVASTALSVVGIYTFLKWRGNSKNLYATISLVSFVFAYLFRKNVLIILIAVMLAAMVEALRSQRWKMALMGLLVIILPMAGMSGVSKMYEIRSGNKIADGIPAVMWMAMGLQDDYRGSGVFNGYTESTYRGMGNSDTEYTAQIGMEYIKGRLVEFAQDPNMAKDFFKEKIQLQWIEPTYSSLIMTSKFGDGPTELTQKIYFGTWAENIIKFMNYYNFVIFAGVVLFAVFALFKRDSACETVLLIAVIGGFLFSIMWEAKGRYVLPYVVFLIPYMCQGIGCMQKSVENIKKLHFR